MTQRKTYSGTFKEARDDLQTYIYRLGYNGFSTLPPEDLRQEAEIAMWEAWQAGERRAGHLCRTMMWRVKRLVHYKHPDTLTGAHHGMTRLDNAVFLDNQGESFDRDEADLAVLEASEQREPDGVVADVVKRALDEMTKRQREVYERLYIWGWSQRQVADDLGIRQDAVAHMNKRIKNKIQRLLEEQGHEHTR